MSTIVNLAGTVLHWRLVLFMDSGPSGAQRSRPFRDHPSTSFSPRFAYRESRASMGEYLYPEFGSPC